MKKNYILCAIIIFGAVIIFAAVFSGVVLAQIADTCPTNNNSQQYGGGDPFTCPDSDLDNAAAGGCVDVYVDADIRQRQVYCYPSDRGPIDIRSHCGGNLSQHPSCGPDGMLSGHSCNNARTDAYICYWREGTGGCTEGFSSHSEWKQWGIYCYPPDFIVGANSVVVAVDINGDGIGDCSMSGAVVGMNDGLCHTPDNVGGVGQQPYWDGTKWICNDNNSVVNGFCVASGGADQVVNADGSCDIGSGLTPTAFTDGHNYCVRVSASFIVTPPPSGYAPFSVGVNAGASVGATAYDWNWNAENNPTLIGGWTSVNGGVAPSHPYEHDTVTAQTYTVRLTVQHNITSPYDGSTVRLSAPPTADRAVTILPKLPYASFTAIPPEGPGPLHVTADASASHSRITGSSIGNYRWDWGDGLPITNISTSGTTHIYVPVGVYTITLTVTDALAGTTASVTQTITVTGPYVCDPLCSGATPVCGPSAQAGQTQCYACLSDSQCGAEYQCLGTVCAQGDRCPDDSACPADRRCAEATVCKTGSQCPDGAACPASGICAAAKNICALSADAVPAECYIEQKTLQTICQSNADCTDGLNGGVCNTQSGACEYARCLYQNGAACATDNDCAGGDGICSNFICNYIYDCAYGPGFGGPGLPGLYIPATATALPQMPLGVQQDGQACTQPTVNAPNNCEGINGCLYYNYNNDGTAVPATAQNPLGNSVANCINEFEGGTGCVYYGNQAAGAPASAKKANCLPRARPTKTNPAFAGIPLGCEAVVIGNNKKEYDCTAVDGCYYFADGKIDCTFVSATATACTTDAQCAAGAGLFSASVCNAQSLCENKGTGCVYDPNPEGAILCPGALTPATAGKNFVQCLLNPDALLPGFALGAGGDGLSSCRTASDCGPGNICLNGTCYPQCQNNQSCASGEQCLFTCATSGDCFGNLVCNAGVCEPPNVCIPGEFSCPNGAPCPANGRCPIGGGLSCSDTTLSHSLSYGTLSAPIGIRTKQTASCRYELRPGQYDATLNIPYSTMPGAFTAADSLNHSATVNGLFTGYNTVYVKCQNAAAPTQISSCSIPLTVGTPCASNEQCDESAPSCIDGFCEAPVCANARPQGALPYSTLTSGTTIGLDTSAASTCVYAADFAAAEACNTTVQSCPGVTAFTTTGSVAHSSFLSGSSLVLGNDTRYARCQETAPPNSLAPVCRIPFSVALCNADYQCTEAGSQCVNGRCEPPLCAGAAPSGTLSSVTTQVDLNLTTPATASCRYSADYFAAFGAMTPFATTGGTTHSSSGVPVVSGFNTEYVRCQEPTLGTEQFCRISFTVGRAYNECIEGAVCPNGALCPENGVCPPCPLGAIWNPATNQCDVPCSGTSCVNGGECSVATGICPCPLGTVYDAVTGQCDPDSYCTIHPSDPLCVHGNFCDMFPLSPLCNLHGDPPSPDDGGGSCNTLGYTFHGSAITPAGTCNLVAIILALLSWFAWLIGLLAVLSGLRAAFLYITSLGDEKRLNAAKSYLIYTTIGVGASVLSFGIVGITRALLGI